MAKLKQTAHSKAKTVKKKNVAKAKAAAKSKTHARKVLKKTAAAKARALLKGRLRSKAKAARSPLKTKSFAKAKPKATSKDKRLAKVKAAAKKVLAKIQNKAALDKALPQQQVLAKAKADPPGKPGRRTKLTAKEKALVKEFERRELSPADAEARRTRLKNLIVLGKERGYLTYAEINDHLPDDMLDAEQIENIISMINDMGIQVYDEAPDVERSTGST